MKNLRFGSVVLFILWINFFVQAQETLDFSYISPMPGSAYIMPENTIALRNGEIIDKTSLENFTFEVNGSQQGRIPGKTLLASDQKTLMFLPDVPFQWGERIFVKTTASVETKKGQIIKPVSFWFDVAKELPELPEKYFLKKDLELAAALQKPVSIAETKLQKDNNLPDDFPELTVNFSNQPNETEYYFVAPFGYWGWFPDNVPYLIIFDHAGTPVYYQKLLAPAYDFKLQPNGNLSYHYNLWPISTHIEVDSSYKQVDVWEMGNGYGRTDFHELLLLPNDHAIVMCYDAQLVDMSQVVQGGHPNAIVSGWIIQEQDSEKNVLFQWRSWDHFAITDCDEHVNLLDSIIDPIHGNSIELAGDDAILLSPRNFNEVTKIDRNTGEIIWRLGGENNMFTFTNDTLRFSRAHDVRLMENGHISLFDNGTYHPAPEFSSAVEYAVDEENFEVTLINRIQSDPDILGVIMGNAQHTIDGELITGWGSGVPGLTEFNSTDQPSLEVYFSGINYRAFRFPWKTNLFTFSADSLHFGSFWYQETRTKTFEVKNLSNEPITFTSYFTNGIDYIVENEFPITIPANETATVEVKIAPVSAGTYTDVLTLNSDINSDTLVQRVAQQIKLVGYATQNQSVTESADKQLHLYPNPAKDQLRIDLRGKTSNGKFYIYDIHGKLIKTISTHGQSYILVNVKDLSPGNYSIRFVSLSGNLLLQTNFIKN